MPRFLGAVPELLLPACLYDELVHHLRGWVPTGAAPSRSRGTEVGTYPQHGDLAAWRLQLLHRLSAARAVAGSLLNVSSSKPPHHAGSGIETSGKPGQLLKRIRHFRDGQAEHPRLTASAASAVNTAGGQRLKNPDCRGGAPRYA